MSFANSLIFVSSQWKYFVGLFRSRYTPISSMSTNRFKEYIFLLSYRPSLNYKERLYMSTLSMLVKNIQDPEPHKVTILDFSLDGMVPPKPPGVIPTEGVYSARRKAKGDRSQVLSFEYQELPNARKDPQFTTGIESLFLYLEKMDSQYQAACIFYIGHGDYNSLGFSRFVTSRSVNVYSWSGDWKKVRENIHPHCFVKLLSCAKVNVFSFQSDYCNYRSDEAQRDPNNSGFSIDEINEVLSPFDHSLLDNFTEAEIIQWFRGTIRRRSLARTLYNPLGDGRKLVELNCFEIEDLNVRDELYSPVLYRLFKTFYAKGGSKSFRRGANATYFAPAKKLAEQMHKVMFKPIGGNYAYSSSIAVVLSHYLGVPVHAAAIGIGQSFFDVKNWYVNRRGFDDLENWEGGIFVTNPKSLDKKKFTAF